MARGVMRVRVKICGITRPEDAVAASEAGADAIGFVFCPSRRRIDPSSASAISRAVPPLICRVGLFVNPSRDEILRLTEQVPLNVVQLHGEESVAFCRSLSPLKVIKAVRIGGPDDIDRASDYEGVSTLLFDAKSGDQLGAPGCVSHGRCSKTGGPMRPLSSPAV